jgi:hypothetical protein
MPREFQMADDSGSEETASGNSDGDESKQTGDEQPQVVSQEDFRALQSTLTKQITAKDQVAQVALHRADAAEKRARAADDRAFAAEVASIDDPDEASRRVADRSRQASEEAVQVANRRADEAVGLADRAGRFVAAQEAAARYGLPTELHSLLEGLPTPEDVEAKAQSLRETIDAAVKASGGEGKSDAGQSGAPDVDSGTGDAGGGSTYDSKKYEHTGDVAGSLRARRTVEK